MAYIGIQPAEKFTSFATQTFSVSATTSYTLDHAVANENEIALFVNNVRQQPGSGKAYTASGTALTLSAATASTDTMYCIFLGRALQTVTPATNSITAAMVGNDLISGKTALGATPADTDEFLVSDAGTLKRVDYSYIKGLSNWSESSGNLLAGNASYGIYLGVNTATAANLLDDYEEGTWTPTFTHGGSSVSYTLTRANYTKIGRLVYVTMTGRYTGSSLTGGDLIGSGLPFTSSSDNVLGVTGGYIHDPGSGNTNYDAGIAGSHNGNTDFYLIVTPGGRYQQRWLQNYYLQTGFWYFV